MNTEIDEAKKRVRICKAKMKIASDRKLNSFIKSKLRDEFYKAQDILVEKCLEHKVEASITDINGCRKEIQLETDYHVVTVEKDTPLTWM